MEPRPHLFKRTPCFNKFRNWAARSRKFMRRFPLEMGQQLFGNVSTGSLKLLDRFFQDRLLFILRRGSWPQAGGGLRFLATARRKPPHGSIQIRCVTSILLNRRSAVIGWNLVSLGALTGSLVHRLQRRPRSPTLFSFWEGFFLPSGDAEKRGLPGLIRSEIGLPK